MLDTRTEHRKGAMAVCAGTWSLAVLSGVDQYRRPFVTVLMDPMAAGLGARADSDGVDSGGVIGIVMGRIPDVEMVEFMTPLLYLWRREESDSGGPGRYRGGVSASLCAIPHRTDSPMHLVVSGSGKAVNMNVGLDGGYPGNSQMDVTIRGSNIRELLDRGIIPEKLDAISGMVEYQPSEKESYLDPADVHYVFWQAGGGWGDPILRAPASVARDVAELHVSHEAARDIYGVVMAGREADLAATMRERERIRAERRARARMPVGGPTSESKSSAGLNRAPMNDNLVEVEAPSERTLRCAHCDRRICASSEPYLGHLAMIESDPQAAGPQIFPEPWRFIDHRVVFRQFCCPGCFTVFASRIVPENHPMSFDLDSPA
jgi:N-methylhydantoinase B